MFKPTGARTADAIVALTRLGWTSSKLAAEIGVSRRTISRWTAGGTPALRNLTRVRALVSQCYMVALADPRTITATPKIAILEAASEALLTDDERTEQAAFDAEMKARFQAAREHQWDTETRSITRNVDPFALCQDAESRQADAIDALFAGAGR